jgi:hypothetical protein
MATAFGRLFITVSSESQLYNALPAVSILVAATVKQGLKFRLSILLLQWFKAEIVYNHVDEECQNY